MMTPHILIIAEAGINHNGKLELAKQLALTAKNAGADIIKYQSFVAENLVSKFANKAEYQKKNQMDSENQLNLLKSLELSFLDFIELKAYCDSINIHFLSTPFDLESIDFLEKLGINLWKIPSGDITNTPYLIRIAKTGKDIILSTGMTNIEEIDYAVQTLINNGSGKITLLHCNTEYPTPFYDANLNAIKTMKNIFKLNVGYSDHTLGIEAAIAAVAIGATVIEKHFTLDKNFEGPDHKASLNPFELKSMIKAIRNIEVAMGTGIKKPTESELKNIEIARKSIIASKDIQRGDIFTEENITIKRPGTGISPTKWFDVLGTVAKRDFNEDELIEI